MPNEKIPSVIQKDPSCSRNDCFEDKSHQLIAFVYINKATSPIIAVVGIEVCAYHANLDEIELITPYIKPQMMRILSTQEQLKDINIEKCLVAYHWIPMDTLDLSKAGDGHYKGKQQLAEEYAETFVIGEDADKHKAH